MTGGSLARLERSTIRELRLSQRGPEGLVRTWKLYWRLHPLRAHDARTRRPQNSERKPAERLFTFTKPLRNPSASKVSCKIPRMRISERGSMRSFVHSN